MTGLDGKENFLYEYGFDWLVTMSMVIAVGLGGLIGAVARFLIVEAVVQFLPNEHSYWGTVTVNLLGCFVIGILIAWSEKSAVLSPWMHRCVITGLLGSLTTFSTFALDAVNLIQAGRIMTAMLNVGGQIFAGILLVVLGMLTVR